MLARFTILLATNFATLHGFSQAIEEEWSQFQAQLHSGTANVPTILIKEENARDVITLSYGVNRDSVPQVRSRVYFLVQKIGVQTRQLELRQEAVHRLVAAAHDADGGNVGQVWSLLSGFNKIDFSNKAKDSLGNFLRQRKPHLDQLLKLIGYLEIQDAKPDIELLVTAGGNKHDRWAALLALARMSDAEATRSVIARVQKIKTNDDVVDELYPDLVYTRQREAVDLMITTLNSDERNCTAADENEETAISCGFRVMEQLAPIIEDYPVKLDQNGDIRTTSYEDALVSVRKWFRQRAHSYKINTKTF